jgi:hypothetical protein
MKKMEVIFFHNNLFLSLSLGRCSQIPPCTSPITFVVVPTKGVTSMATTTIVEGIVMLDGKEA